MKKLITSVKDLLTNKKNAPKTIVIKYGKNSDCCGLSQALAKISGRR